MRNWDAAAALTPPTGAQPFCQAITYWARAIGAGHRRDAKASAEAVKQYDTMVEATRNSTSAFLVSSMETNHDEAAAWLSFAKGDNDQALVLLRKVADREDRVGTGEVELPAREMLGNMLLEMNRAPEALAEYERSMQIDPNRFNGLAGAARAAELSHQGTLAARYSARLLKNCGGRTPIAPSCDGLKVCWRKSEFFWHEVARRQTTGVRALRASRVLGLQAPGPAS